MLENYPISSLRDITPKIWFAYTDTRLKSRIQPTSINTALRSLRSFLTFAHESGNSICDRMLEIRPLKTRESLPRDIIEAELNQLLKHGDTHDQAWILLTAHSGLRTCEIRALQWRDIDLKRRTVCIEESKGLRSRVVYMGQPTIKALKKLPKTSKYVFTFNDRALSNRYCQSRLKAIGKKCGIHVSPHQLRSTCATMLLNAGMSIFGVQLILGHKYLDTTLRYVRVHDSVVAKSYKQAQKMVQRRCYQALYESSIPPN